MKFLKKILFASFMFSTIMILSGCGDKLPVVDNLNNKEYKLVDQNNKNVVFPKMCAGKIIVAGYIFTNCPDICPLTTNNMHIIQNKLKEEKIPYVEFVSISFDPLTDTQETLRKFAEIRELDLSNWSFLTGQKPTIDSLMKEIGVLAVVNDSTIFKDGRKIYYYVHTDRIQLIDKDGKIRKNYPGSKINVDEIVADIKTLSRE